MSAKNPVKKPQKRTGFPWLPLLLLLGSIYYFWIYPQQRGHQPVRVDFSQEKS